MQHQHYFSLNISPQAKYTGGSRTSVTAAELPALDHISMALLKIDVGCIREPHWHPNAHEMAYCLNGQGVVTIFSPGNHHDTFTIAQGELFFVPMGAIHYIANTGESELAFLLAYSHKTPEDLDLSQSVLAMTDHVLAATFNSNSEFFQGLRVHGKHVFITSQSVVDKPAVSFIANHFKINAEAIHPQILTKGGSAKIVNKETLPAVENLCLFSLRINPKGIREPHWHPNANELNYVINGSARITVFSPGGKLDVFEINVGEGSYIPASYLHVIENIGEGELRMAVFFSNSAPNDIGLSGALSSYSHTDLAAIFGVPLNYFEKLPHFEQDVMVVAGGG